jgi:hypothetical protein
MDFWRDRLTGSPPGVSPKTGWRPLPCDCIDGVGYTDTDALVLRETQRVRLVVEPLDDDAALPDRSAALQQFPAGIEGMRFFSRGRLASRDELHGRP